MGGGKGGDAPDAPNPKKVIPLEGAENRRTALTQAMLANANVKTPYGTQRVTWVKDPVTGNYTPNLTQAYTPGQQEIFDINEDVQKRMGLLGLDVADAAGGALGQPLDFSGAPAMPGDATAIRDKVIAAMMGRVNEDTARTRDQVHSELIAAGIPAGSKAYADRMALIDRGYNDARDRAFLSAGQEAARDFGMGLQGRQQGISEILAQRQQPLNELSAIRTGAQIAPLQFGQTQGAPVRPTDVAGAYDRLYQGQLDAYNARVGQQNSLLGTAGQLGAAAIFAGF